MHAAAEEKHLRTHRQTVRVITMGGTNTLFTHQLIRLFKKTKNKCQPALLRKLRKHGCCMYKYVSPFCWKSDEVSVCWCLERGLADEALFPPASHCNWSQWAGLPCCHPGRGRATLCDNTHFLSNWTEIERWLKKTTELWTAENLRSRMKVLHVLLW